MFTDLSHRALLFALCSFVMCACFAPTLSPFPEVPYKSSIRGRE